MWKRIGLAAVVLAILAGSAAAVVVDNNQGNDGSQNLNQRDGSGNPDSGGGKGNRGGQQGQQGGTGPPGGGGERGQRQGFEGAEEPVAEDEWISLEGVVTAFDGAIVTIETEDGESVDLKLGPPRFLESLDVTFETGDELEVLGFYENELFNAAEITLVESGEQIVLRDAEGYPLWGGGGRQGQGGQGRSGEGQGNNNGSQ
jgi:hypothetical protein